MVRHHDIILISLDLRLPLTRSLPLLHPDPLSRKLELIQLLFGAVYVVALAEPREGKLRVGYQGIQLFFLGIQLPQSLALLFPPEQHTNKVSLSVDVQHCKLMREAGSNLRCVDGSIIRSEESVFLQRFMNPLADALRVNNSSDIKGAFIQSVRVLRGDLVHVAHVAAEGGQVTGADWGLISEEVGDGSVSEAGEREAEGAIAFAIHDVHCATRPGGMWDRSLEK